MSDDDLQNNSQNTESPTQTPSDSTDKAQAPAPTKPVNETTEKPPEPIEAPTENSPANSQIESPQQTLESSPEPVPVSFPVQNSGDISQNQSGFVRALLAKAQEKIQSNKRKKLDKILQFAQMKEKISNADTQKLLRISSATATRYLSQLTKEGKLSRIGSPKDAYYQFVR